MADANKFGTSYLQKFGWDSSVGLGPSGEGRTKHISVYQKLDMLGIGADHRNNEDGTAWKQGRDYENLLRRLNESTGKDIDAEAVMKVDGFVRPASGKESAELQTDGQTEADEEREESRKSKKRKHRKGDSAEVDEDDRKDKKKRKKEKSADEKVHKKEKKQKHRDNANEGDSPDSNKRLSDSDPGSTVEARSNAVPAIVPRPYVHFHSSYLTFLGKDLCVAYLLSSYNDILSGRGSCRPCIILILISSCSTIF